MRQTAFATTFTRTIASLLSNRLTAHSSLCPESSPPLRIVFPHLYFRDILQRPFLTSISHYTQYVHVQWTFKNPTRPVTLFLATTAEPHSDMFLALHTSLANATPAQGITVPVTTSVFPRDHSVKVLSAGSCVLEFFLLFTSTLF